jgi:hypothetical protein
MGPHSFFARQQALAAATAGEAGNSTANAVRNSPMKCHTCGMKLPQVGSVCPYCRAHKALTRRRRIASLIYAIVVILVLALIFAIEWFDLK